MPAVDRLVAWTQSTEDGTPRLCALLGDLGMGKTTTAKMLTKRLLELRASAQESGQTVVPVLFDLRRISAKALPDQPTLRDVIKPLLKAMAATDQVTADRVLKTIARGDCLVIFDGLDEVLVHLDPHQGQLFVQALWQVIEQGEGTGQPTRLMLTCRTHYFRSIREEVSSFTGHDRDGPMGRDYLALLMLPFSEDQIRTYLKQNVPGMDVDDTLELISSVHNLRELAERPLMLSYVTEQLEFIERAKLHGQTIRPVDMYGAMVERWLARDLGKHVLLAEHKI